jgi:hypothetical protein
MHSGCVSQDLADPAPFEELVSPATASQAEIVTIAVKDKEFVRVSLWFQFTPGLMHIIIEQNGEDENVCVCLYV